MASVGGGLIPQRVGGPVTGGSTDQAYVKASGNPGDAAWQSPPLGTPMTPVYRSQYWYDQRLYSSVAGSLAMAAGTCIYTPWYLPAAVTIDALAATSTGANTSGVLAAAGISEYLSPLQPGRVLVKATVVLPASTSGAQILTITALTLNAGWYFWTVGASAALTVYAGANLIRQNLPSNASPLSGTVPNLGTEGAAYSDSHPQPIDYPANLSLVAGVVGPLVPFRIA